MSEATAQPSEKRGGRRHTRPTLLVVDDDESIIELVESLLEEEMDVVSAQDGWDALKVAAESEPDIALIDLMMPGINGLTLTEELRKQPRYQRLRVFIMSAHAGLMPEVERLRVEGFFLKPFEPDQLIARLIESAGEL